MQAVDEIEKLMQQCNSDIIAVICNRLKTIGELTPTDAIRLSNLAHTEDLNKIMDILSSASEKSLNEVNRAIEEASKENDDLAEQYYQARNMDTTVRSDVLQGIQSRAEDAMKDDILNLSGTAGFYMNGKPTSITATYTNMINKGIYATQQGTMTYQQAIRSAVKQLADSGLRVVDFESGYSRRLDSQVRMNVLDGIRQMNMEYREQQGKEFGADGVEITAHALCAPDHQPYQGKQYSLKDFEYLQSTLRRPIGLMNCRHSTTPIIIGISEPAYSDEQLQNFKDNSNEQVIYNDKLGNEQTCTRYEATQLQRKQETMLRRLKDEKNAYEVLGDDLMVGELDQKIRAQTKYYKDMSAEVGLRPKMERARVQKAQENIWSKKKSSVPASTIIKEVPKVVKQVEQPMDITTFTTKLQELNDIQADIFKRLKQLEFEVLSASEETEEMWNRLQELSKKNKDALANIEKFKNDNPALWKKWQEIEAEKNKLSDEYLEYKKGLEAKKINIIDVGKHYVDMTIDEKIKRLGGADKTSGSCASVGLAYIGQKYGYDVLDFRGGASMDWFSSKLNKIEMFKSLDVKSIVESSGASSLTNGKRILSKMEKGKEYYLSVGRHASIVRLNDDGVMQYLELQSSNNGWKDIVDTGYTMKNRFGCSSSSRYYSTAYLTDIEQLKDKKEFVDLLGFINTYNRNQLKGVGGYAK